MKRILLLSLLLVLLATLVFNTAVFAGSYGPSYNKTAYSYGPGDGVCVCPGDCNGDGIPDKDQIRSRIRLSR